jgi:hypothetical protein
LTIKSELVRQATLGDDALAELTQELSQKIKLTKLASLLDCHVGALHRARKDGKLQCFKFLGRWYTSPSSVREMIARSSSKGMTATPEIPAGTRTALARTAAADAAIREIASLTA